MDKFICISRCPEMDSNNSRHCIMTKEELEERKEQGSDYCFCGNKSIWEKMNSPTPYQNKYI